MRQYGRRYDPDRMSAYEAPQKRQEMGRAEGYEDGEHLTRDQAEKWVRGMKSEDGKTGGRWPYEEIKRYAANFGIQGEEHIVEFFAVMNALYSDYCKVAKKYGVDKTDFWADLAKALSTTRMQSQAWSRCTMSALPSMTKTEKGRSGGGGFFLNHILTRI